MTAWCDHCDLPDDQCAHSEAAQKAEASLVPTVTPDAPRSLSRIEGARCQHCHKEVELGSPIVLTSDGWAHDHHYPSSSNRAWEGFDV